MSLKLPTLLIIKSNFTIYFKDTCGPNVLFKKHFVKACDTFVDGSLLSQYTINGSSLRLQFT